MAASQWVFFNEAKKYLMTHTGGIDPSGDQFYVSLHTSAWTPSVTISTQASVGNEVANANGYTTGGKSVTTTWASGASAGEWRFTFTNSLFWSAAGGNISAVRYAVIRESGGKALAYSPLSTAQFSVTATNRLTIAANGTNGVFELNHV